MAHRRSLAAGSFAILTEIKTGLTFAKVALSSRFGSKRARNTSNARKAYDTARRWAEETVLTPEEAIEIDDQLQLLKADLAKLKRRSTT